MIQTEIKPLLQHTVITDPNTGEFWETEREEFKQKRIIPVDEPQVAKYNKKEDDPRVFTFVKHSGIREIVPKLNNKQLGYVMMLSTYCNYRNELYLTENGKIPMTVEDVAGVLGQGDKRTTTTTIETLIKIGVLAISEKCIYKTEYPVITLNKTIFFKGRQRKGIAVTKEFSEATRKVYEQNSSADLGWLSKLIPYIDLQTNFLCHNPSRNYDCDELEPLSVADIVAITGVGRKYVYQRISSMKIDEYSVFAEVTTFGKQKKYKINPLIFCRMQGQASEVVLKDFTTGTLDN